MPDRVIRDELLTSERYWSVSIEAQRLFVHLILNADDLGRFSGKNYTVRSACFPGQAVDPAKVEKLLIELHDTDLVRLYECDGERFIFLPRFKQRLRFTRSRYPAPPKEISDLQEEKTDSSLTQDRRESDSSRQKRREVKRSEEKKTKGRAFALPDWLPSDAWNDFEESRQKLRKPLTDRARHLAVAELQRLREKGNDPIAVIERSVLRGWQTFYPLTKDDSGPGPSGATTRVFDGGVE